MTVPAREVLAAAAQVLADRGPAAPLADVLAHGRFSRHTALHRAGRNGEAFARAVSETADQFIAELRRFRSGSVALRRTPSAVVAAAAADHVDSPFWQRAVTWPAAVLPVALLTAPAFARPEWVAAVAERWVDRISDAGRWAGATDGAAVAALAVGAALLDQTVGPGHAEAAAGWADRNLVAR